MANIRVTCPTCKVTLEIDERYTGQEVECGSCFETFVAERPSSRRKWDDDEDEEERPSRRRSRRDDDDDDEDYAPRRRRVRRRPSEGGNPAAALALVLGILSVPFMCCCTLISIPVSLGGAVCGFIGMQKEEGKGMAITGLVLSLLSLVLSVLALIFVGMQGNGPGGPFNRGFGR